jgi:hypothetical protein
MIIESRVGKEIRSAEDWFRGAPPKRGKRQRRDGRSAKEFAKAWCRDRALDAGRWHCRPPKEKKETGTPVDGRAGSVTERYGSGV